MRSPIEDFFVDKKQLKKYKKGTLNREIIYLRNDGVNNLELNIDTFIDNTIVIYDTNFDSLKIFSKNSNVYRRLIIKDCRINNCIINLNDNSFVEINKTKLGNTDIKTASLKLNKIKGFESDDKLDRCAKINCDVKTDIFIENTFMKDNEKVYFSIESDYLKINNSLLFISDAKLNNVHIFNSNLYSNNFKVLSVANLIDTKLASIDQNDCAYFLLTNLNCREVKIKHCTIDSKVICISRDTDLYIYNSFVVSKSEIILEKFANLLSNNYQSLNNSNISLLKNARITTNNLNFINNEDNVYEININDLIEQQQKLTKVLKLALEKNNKPMISEK